MTARQDGPPCHPDAFWTAGPRIPGTTHGDYVAVCSECGAQARSAPTATEVRILDFLDRLSMANKARNALWDENRKLTEVFHALELAGEVGELCNVIKKLERARLNLKGSRATYDQLIGEFGDVLIVLSLLANACNVDLKFAARQAFNKKSTELGFEIFI